MADERNIEQHISIKVDTNANEASKEVNNLSSAIDKTTESQNKNQSETKQNNESLKSFKTQVREATQELLKLSQTYGETSKEAVQAAKKVADLKDQMQFSKDLVDKFNPDQKFKALGAATQIATTATSGLVSGMALFGEQSEDTQKQLLKVQAAMAFSDAISGLSDLGDQWATLKTVVASNSIVMKANGVATLVTSAIMKGFSGSVDTTSTSFKGLKVAISATGIGLLVTGLAMLINNFDSIKKAVLNVVPGLSAIGDTVMSIVNAVTDFIGVTSDATRATDRMKANADASLALNKKFLAEHESQLDEFTKQKIEAKNKYNEAIKEDGADQIALGQELNRQLAKIEYSRGDEKRKIAEENAKKDAEDAKKRAEEELKRKKEEEDRKKELIKEGRDAEIAALKELQDLNDKTEEEKLARQKERDLAEIEALKAKGIEVTNLMIYHDEKFKLLEEELRLQREKEAAEKEDEAQKLKKEREKEAAEKEAEAQQSKKEREAQIDADRIQNKENIENALVSISRNGQDAMSALEELGLKKSRATEGIKKGIALTQIAADSAMAISTAIPTALKAGQEAAKIAGPAAAVVGPLVTGASLVSSFALVAKNVATAKKLLSSGGGGGVSAPSAGGGGSSAPTGASATPQVAFQASSENQIASTIAKNTNEQPPIKAFVVSKEVTTAQSLDRNKLDSNSF